MDGIALPASATAGRFSVSSPRALRRVPMTQETESIDARLTRILNAFGARLGILLRSYHLDRQGIDPADVEQEVRIRLWKAIERDRSGAFHASYVQRVVATTVIDALRRAEVRAAEPLPEVPERRRLPITMHLQGHSLQEIADVVGVSAEAARKLVSRGLDGLKARLNELGYGDFDD